MKRVVVPELLDSDAGTPEEIKSSLEDLRWLNANFGGVSTTTQLLKRVAHRTNSKRLSFLDVAGAMGDVANGVRDRLNTAGIELEVTVLDRSATHLAVNTTSIVGDALQLPFRDCAFDVAGSNLFLHHLDPKQVAPFIDECLRISRYGCIVNDLKRSYFHLLAAYAGRLLYRSPITSHDAVASVQRAYTKDELRELLRHCDAEYSHHFFCRMGIIIWKKA